MDKPRINSVQTMPAMSHDGTPGWYSEIENTRITAQALNHITGELVGMVEGAGLSLDPDDPMQLKPVMERLIRWLDYLLRERVGYNATLVVGNEYEVTVDFAASPHANVDVQLFRAWDKMTIHHSASARVCSVMVNGGYGAISLDSDKITITRTNPTGGDVYIFALKEPAP